METALYSNSKEPSAWSDRGSQAATEPVARASDRDPRITILRRTSTTTTTTTTTFEGPSPEGSQGVSSGAIAGLLGVAMGAMGVGAALTYNSIKKDREPDAMRHREAFAPGGAPISANFSYSEERSFGEVPYGENYDYAGSAFDARHALPAPSVAHSGHARSVASSAKGPRLLMESEYRSQAGSQFSPSQFGNQYSPSQAGSRYNPSQAGSQYSPTYVSRANPGDDGASRVSRQMDAPPSKVSMAPSQARSQYSAAPSQASQARSQYSAAPSQASQARSQYSAAPSQASQARSQYSTAPSQASQARSQYSTAPSQASQARSQHTSASKSAYHTTVGSSAPSVASERSHKTGARSTAGSAYARSTVGSKAGSTASTVKAPTVVRSGSICGGRGGSVAGPQGVPLPASVVGSDNCSNWDTASIAPSESISVVHLRRPSRVNC